ncbi:MAG: hypothetical protein KGI37_04345 [Alphaproteobacteria bacterium]|nr:hypothetical protein [Alphaproteobacteria bacterium]
MSIAKNLRAGGKMVLLSAIAVGMALPAYAQSQGGFNSTTDDVTFSASGVPIMGLHDGKGTTPFGATFSGPITEGATTINTDGSMVVGSNNGTTPTLVVNGPIQPGSSNIVVGNACSTEGTLAYDPSNHEPVYCSKSAVWTAMAGGATFSSMSSFAPASGVLYANSTGAAVFLSSVCPNSPFKSGYHETVDFYVYDSAGNTVQASHGQIQEGGSDANFSAAPYASVMVPANDKWSIVWSPSNIACRVTATANTPYLP